MSPRRLLIAAFVALIAIAVTSCGPAASPRSHAAARPGNFVSETPAAKVRIAWSDDVHGDVRAIAADADGEVATVNGDEVVALDLDGRVQWSVPLDGASSGRVVLDGDRVIVPISRADGLGGCAGLDRDTGETRWNYISVGTRGIAVAQAGELAICVMRNGTTAGIWPESGMPQWEFFFGSTADSAGAEVPDGTAVTVDQTSGVFAFIVHVNGWWEVTWRKIETGRGTVNVRLGRHGAPAGLISFAGWLVAVTSMGHARVVDLRGRTETPLALSVSGGFNPATAPVGAVVGARDVVVVASGTGNVVAFQFHKPFVRWAVHTGEPMRNPQSVIIGTTVIVAASSGRLLGFRLTDGATVALPTGPGRGILTTQTGDRSSMVIAANVPGGARIERWVAGSAA